MYLEVKKEMSKKKLLGGKISAFKGIEFDYREFGGPHGIRFSSGEKRFCPNCGTLSGAKSCPHCYTRLR